MERPPRLLLELVRAFVPRDRAEFVLGDLEEMFGRRAERSGRAAACRWFLIAGLRSAIASRRRTEQDADVSRHVRRRFGMDGLRADVRIGIRSLAQRPSFALLAAGTLALGLGAATAVFGVVNQIVLRPLPGVRAGAGAAYVIPTDPSSGQSLAISLPALEQVREGSLAASGLAGFSITSLLAQGPASEPEALTARAVAGDWFEVLGVRAHAGRLFGPEEGADEAVVVLSERARARFFGADADVVGRTIQLNRRPVMVIGVTGDGFAGVQPWLTVDAWLPLATYARLEGIPAAALSDPSRLWFSQLVARPRDGVSFDALQEDLTARLAAAVPDGEAMEARVHPRLGVEPMWRADTTAALRLLSGVVLLVLLIACANVANLLLHRGLLRREETAVRRALGASGMHVARQHLVECLILACTAVLAGIVVAFLIARLLEGMQLATTARLDAFRVDVRVLAFMAALVIATTLLAGGLPALLAGRTDLRHAMGSAGRETGRHGSLGTWVTIGQLALSLCLLVSSLLLVRTVQNLYAVDPGYDLDGLYLATTFSHHVAEGDAAAYERRLLDALRDVPGAEDAALDAFGPLGPSFTARVRPAGAPPDDAVRVRAPLVSPRWFATMGVPLVEGDGFGPADWNDAQADGVVLSRNLATLLFGAGTAVGRTVELEGIGFAGSAIVSGVAADVRLASVEREADLVAYRNRASQPASALTALVRARSVDASMVIPAIREAARAAGPDLPAPDIVPLRERLDRRLADQRFFARVLTLLSVLAVFLAAIGLYGVLGQGVAERTREFGIRRALGARNGRIVRQVLLRALGVVVVGVALGLPAAFVLARVIRSRLFGVGPLDPVSWIGAVLLFVCAALAACAGPLRTATRIEPMAALREG